MSVSVQSRRTQFLVAFTTNIAESNFRYTQDNVRTVLLRPGRLGLGDEDEIVILGVFHGAQDREPER